MKNKDYYNEEPVLYCKHCLSLKIKNIPCMEDSDYCDECSSTDIGETTISEWEKMYMAKFDCKYLDN